MIKRVKSIPARLAASAAPFLLAAGVVAQPILPSGTSSGIPAPSSTDPVEALGRFLRVLATSPKDLDALTGAGNAALAIGDANAAISFFARAEEIAPRDGRIKAGLASALVQTEQPKTALKLFEDAVRLGVPDAEVGGDRGLAYDLRGENRRAQQEYARALAWRPDDEITRRLAVSQAITGDRDAAMKTLDALLRRQDRASWRVRAFVLALTGDGSGAEEAAVAAMPRAQAQALMPYFGRLAALRPGEKAAAVHLGQFPSDGRAPSAGQTLFADAGDVPPRPQPAAPRSDVPLIPMGAALGARTASADVGEEGSRAPRRRPGATATVNGRPDATATLLAAAAANLRRESLAPPPAARVAPTPVQAPPPVIAAALPQPAVVAVASQPAQPAAATPPPASAARVPPYGPTPDLAAGPGFTDPLSPRSLANPTSVDRSAAALLSPPETGGMAASSLPPPAATPAPAIRGIDLPASSVARADPPVASPAAASLPAVAVPAVAAPVVVAVPPRAPTIVLAPPPPARPVQLAANAAAADLPRPARVASASPAAATEGKEAAKEKPAEPKGSRKEESKTKLAAVDAKATKDAKAKDAKSTDKAKDTKTADKAKAAKDAKLADKAKDAKNAEKPASKDKAPAGERYWVQVASGANKSDLGKAWEKTKAQAPKLLAGRATWTAPWKASNRLLVGPFKTEDEAQGFVNSLGKAGMGGMQFTSRGAAKVERLATK